MTKTTLASVATLFVATFTAVLPNGAAAAVCQNETVTLTPAIENIWCLDFQCIQGSDGLGITMVQSLPGGIGGNAYCENSVGSATCFGAAFCNDEDHRFINDDDAVCEGYSSTGFIGIMFIWLMCYNIPCARNCIGMAAPSSAGQTYALEALPEGWVPAVGDSLCSMSGDCQPVLANSASIVGTATSVTGFLCSERACEISPVICVLDGRGETCRIE